MMSFSANDKTPKVAVPLERRRVAGGGVFLLPQAHTHTHTHTHTVHTLYTHGQKTHRTPKGAEALTTTTTTAAAAAAGARTLGVEVASKRRPNTPTRDTFFGVPVRDAGLIEISFETGAGNISKAIRLPTNARVIRPSSATTHERRGRRQGTTLLGPLSTNSDSVWRRDVFRRCREKRHLDCRPTKVPTKNGSVRYTRHVFNL